MSDLRRSSWSVEAPAKHHKLHPLTRFTRFMIWIIMSLSQTRRCFDASRLPKSLGWLGYWYPSHFLRDISAGAAPLAWEAYCCDKYLDMKIESYLFFVGLERWEWMESHKERLHMTCYAAKLKWSYIFRNASSRHQCTSEPEVKCCRWWTSKLWFWSVIIR